MRLCHPIYYTCLISALLTGRVQSAVPPGEQVTAPATQNPAREPQVFRLPASEASEALVAFSRQTGTAVVYVIDQVRGIRTNEVNGRYSPREALERLVAHTALTVVEDSRSGALMIKRGPPPPATTPATPPAPKSKPSAETPMKSRNLLAVVAAWLMAAPAIGAQTPAAPLKEDTITLSPFIVTSEAESGYQAKETLAGMRIKTDLKDVAAAVDVLTESFLNDVGAFDMNDAFRYVVNMQYADFMSSDVNNNSQWFSASYISRGVVGSTVLSDFFPTGSVPIDRYSTDNLTFLRGPNSILFGIGSPSGVVGASSKRASLSRNSHTVRFMLDTFGSARTEIDVSRSLLKNRLALRLAAVASDRHTEQEPSLNRRNALYGTVTWKPFTRTMITVNGERGIYDRLHALNNLVADAYTPWVRAGRPTINYLTGKGMINGTTTKGSFSGATGSGLGFISGSSYLVYIEGSGLPVMDWRNMARGANWSETVVAGNPGSGLMVAADRSSMNSIPFTRENALVDLQANVWGGINTNDLDYSSRSIFLEQNLARDLDLELAWNRFDQDYTFTQIGGNGPTVWADPNELLPDGTPNPNVGRPYLETIPRRSREWREFETKRATLSYKLDLDRRKIFRGLGLGNYRFAGLYQDSGYYQKLVASRFVNVTPLPGTPVSLPLNQAQNRLSFRSYLQPGQSAFLYDGRLSFQQATTPGATLAGPVQIEERGSDESPRNLSQLTRSFVAAVQGSWWQAKPGYYRITGLFGQRQDRERDRSQAFVRGANGEYPGPFSTFDGLESFGTWGPETQFTARTKTYNVTFRPWSPLRLLYNFSDIFRAAPANYFDVFDRPLRPSFGQTKDYGAKLDLWSDRLALTATRFETGVIDSSSDNTGAVRQYINDIYATIAQPERTLVRPWSYRNDISKGYEFSLHATLTRDWRSRLTFGTQKTIVSAAFDDWVEYFATNRPLWERYATTPMLNPSTNYRTVADAIVLAETRLRDARAVNGVQPTDQRSRNASFNTNYTFSSGVLKALRIGAGCQWSSPNILGYARDANGNLNTAKPFRGAERFSTDASIGYPLKLLKGRVTWDVQLNLFNLLNENPLFARQAVDDGKGSPLVVRRFTQTPFYAQLTNTFTF